MKDELENFKNWYFAQKRTMRLCVPFDNPLVFVDGVIGLTLYRENNFQVQLFIFEPDVKIPEHIHPNVDSFELFLYGMKFTHSGKTVVDSSTWADMHEHPDHVLLRVKPNDWHGGISSKNGGSFISIQHWLNNTKPTHVTDDWQGDVIGNTHKQQLERQEL